jgi:hypothetical protein
MYNMYIFLAVQFSILIVCYFTTWKKQVHEHPVVHFTSGTTGRISIKFAIEV